jgi:hypothetical protein
MLRKEKDPCFKNIHASQKRIHSFVTRLMKQYFPKLTSCLSTFSFLRSIRRRSTSYSIRVIDAVWCMMWCYAKWCDDMMQNDEDVEDTHPHAHTETHKLCIPLGTTLEPSSPFIFRCKFCIHLGTSFELLRLLFRRYKFCIPLGVFWTSSPYISTVFGSAFPLERLLSRKLTLRSLRNDFL